MSNKPSISVIKPHVIGQIKLDISFDKREKANELQDRISGLWSNGLTEEVDSVFNQYVGNGDTLRIDSLTIDVGSISYENIEAVLPGKIIEALKLALGNRFSQTSIAGEVPENKTTTDRYKGDIELVEYFLFYGVLPWYATNYDSPETVLNRLLAENRQQLRQLLNEIGEHETVRYRLARQFSESTLQEVTKVIAPQHAVAIMAYHKEITGESNAVLPAEEEEELPAKPKMKAKEKPLLETIYIDNAGLVLLHPFLGTYFGRLGMMVGNNFINEESRLRGALLLQYIVFGTEQYEEHKMALNKLLLGIPFETPLPQHIAITDNEKEVSAQLLGAVLQNWDKMKNTSAESFRASFLQREGMLYKENDQWNLRIEPRGYDILLQTLPWGLGMIKAPWMLEFLYIQWI